MSAKRGRDPWRYTCPNGHHSYHRRTTSDAHAPFYCDECHRNGSDPHFTEPIDKKAQ